MYRDGYSSQQTLQRFRSLSQSTDLSVPLQKHSKLEFSPAAAHLDSTQSHRVIGVRAYIESNACQGV